MKIKKVNWLPNDVFAIPLTSNHYATGHVLDQRMVNSVRIALYKGRVDKLEILNPDEPLTSEDLISLIEVTREQLDYGVWKVIGHVTSTIPAKLYPNEQFSSNK